MTDVEFIDFLCLLEVIVDELKLVKKLAELDVELIISEENSSSKFFRVKYSTSGNSLMSKVLLLFKVFVSNKILLLFVSMIDNNVELFDL